MSEQVMVVKTSDLQPLLKGRLICNDSRRILEIIESRHFFIDRPTAEMSPQYRQIIPYVVIRSGDDYFVLQRTAKQTESRLHHKLSLGIGGHVNPGCSLVEGLRKELNEEVRIDADYDLGFLGILNDDSTEVGRVHLGAAYRLDVSTKSVSVLETEKMTGQWRSRAALRDARAAMESWSQIVYDECIA
ncbi:MAG TPA: NUDIX domain-containing protein [Thermoanaerobaculia bacterium]|nr:NUDIX domain-containing protein [Thermoanaerobaculia bacterium]